MDNEIPFRDAQDPCYRYAVTYSCAGYRLSGRCRYFERTVYVRRPEHGPKLLAEWNARGQAGGFPKWYYTLLESS